MLQANDEQEAAMRILGLRGDLIAEITAFATPEVFPWFGLPAELAP